MVVAELLFDLEIVEIGEEHHFVPHVSKVGSQSKHSCVMFKNKKYCVTSILNRDQRCKKKEYKGFEELALKADYVNNFECILSIDSSRLVKH